MDLPQKHGIEFDAHTHTIASGHAAVCTITDMAKQASQNHLNMLGITDHGPATPGSCKPSYFQGLALAPKKRCNIQMMYGVELNILDNRGTLDLPNSILTNLDYSIASMHIPVKKPDTLEQNTIAYIEAMKNPYINMIGHCDDARYPVDYHALVKAAIQHHVILEVNNSSLRPDGYRGDTKQNNLLLLNLCKTYRHPVLLSSDSHGTAHIGDFEYALKLAAEADFPHELILNYSVSTFRNYISEKRSWK